MSTLIEKAKEVHSQQLGDMQEVELALAWLKGELNSRQVGHALGRPHHATYPWLPSRLRIAYQRGLLTISKKSSKKL